MLIGEIAQKTGLSRDAIRFYEKQGLIKIGRKARRENNYKEYPESIVQQILLIKRLKNFGFTLNEIGDFLGLAQYKMASCARVEKAVVEKMASIDEKIAELQALRSFIAEQFRQTNVCCAEVKSGENCAVFDLAPGV
jgi:DNA-binding transcriptional MerR regulator